MDDSTAKSKIPFGKFFNVNGSDKDLIENLRLIKFEEVEPMEPDYFYLFEDSDSGKYYGVHEPGSTGFDEDFNRFIGNEFKNRKEIKPKNTDWFQTHWIYELTK